MGTKFRELDASQSKRTRGNGSFFIEDFPLFREISKSECGRTAPTSQSLTTMRNKTLRKMWRLPSPWLASEVAQAPGTSSVE